MVDKDRTLQVVDAVVVDDVGDVGDVAAGNIAALKVDVAVAVADDNYTSPADTVDVVVHGCRNRQQDWSAY